MKPWHRWLVIGYQPPRSLPDPIEGDEWIEGAFLTSRAALKASGNANSYVIARKDWEARR